MVSYNFSNALFLLLLLCVNVNSLTNIKHKNVCKTYHDYLYADRSENCFYDPDASTDTPDLIQKYAGHMETHQAISEDGYIISLFRIAPIAKAKGVVLFHHSIGTNSRIFLWDGNQSLGFNLWANGYDVWLANHRGTTGSNKHVNLTIHDLKYWNFSFHEMGAFDVASEVKVIRERTNNSKIIFIGHSLGATIGLVYSTIKHTEAREYFKHFIYISPPCFFEYNVNPIMALLPLIPMIKKIVDYLRIGSVVVILPTIRRLSSTVLRLFPIIILMTHVVVSILCGWTPEEADPRFLNMDGAINLDEFSWKTVFHFAQLINLRTEFRQYDYGTEGNLIKYGTTTPPLYPLEKISVPTYIIASEDDTLITAEDAELLYQHLPDDVKVDGYSTISGLNHLDFLVGRHRKTLFTDKLLAFLNRI